MGRPDPGEVEGVLQAIPEVLRAPWTDDQVESLNSYQESGDFHPFTHHDPHGESCGESLYATKEGWRCAFHEDYVQDWAWPWMAGWGWRRSWST